MAFVLYNPLRVSLTDVNNVELLGRVGREPQRIGDNEAIAFPLYTESVLRFKDGTGKHEALYHISC